MKIFHWRKPVPAFLFSLELIQRFRLWAVRLRAARKSIFIAVILISGILQITWFDSFKIFNVKPDFILVAAVAASFVFDFKEAVVLSIFAGALKDSLGAQAFGINTLLFPLWSFLLAQLNRQISIDHEWFRVVIIFVVTLLHNILTGLQLIYSGSIIPSGIFVRIVLLESIYTTLAAMLIFKGQVRFFIRADSSP